MFIHVSWNILPYGRILYVLMLHIYVLHLILPCFKTNCTSEQMYIINTPLNNGTKAPFIFKWWYLHRGLLTFMVIWMFFVRDSWVSALSAGSIARGRPEVVSLPWYSPHLFLSLWHLIGWFCPDLPGQECTYLLMCFYVQANWQWRVPSFCSINISSPIWMQIRDVTPRIQMGLSLPWKITEALCEYDLCKQ